MALKRYWTDPNLSQDEAFLRDYLLNRGYLDMDAYRYERTTEQRKG